MPKYIYSPKQLIVSNSGQVFEMSEVIVLALSNRQEAENATIVIKAAGDKPVTYAIESDLPKEELFEKIKTMGIENFLKNGRRL